MFNLKRWFPLTVTAAIAAAFALAFPPAGHMSAEVPPAESSSGTALSSDEPVWSVSGEATAAVCTALDGDCEDEDFEWASKKVEKKCGESGGWAGIECTDDGVRIDGGIHCFE